jgi:hypothetical protein
MNVVRAIATDAHYVIQGSKAMIRFALPEGIEVFNVTAKICSMTNQLILNGDINYLPPRYNPDGTRSTQNTGGHEGAGAPSRAHEYR